MDSIDYNWLYERFYAVQKRYYHKYFAVVATLAVVILSWATARVTTTAILFLNKQRKLSYKTNN